MARRTKNQLLERIAFYRRNIVNYGWATAVEIDAALEPLPNQTKDDLWQRLAICMSFARRREWHEGPGVNRAALSDDSLNVALAAIEGRSEAVEFPSVKDGDGRPLTVLVSPASWARIMRVEDHDFWLIELKVYRALLRNQLRDTNDRDEHSELDGLFKRLSAEIDFQLTALYSQITAPGPAPHGGEPVDWAQKITPVEERALIRAWLIVNLEPLRTMPKPKLKKTGKDLPSNWAFLFQSVSWREKRPSSEVVRDRSLISMVAENALELLRQQADPKAASGRATAEALSD